MKDKITVGTILRNDREYGIVIRTSPGYALLNPFYMDIVTSCYTSVEALMKAIGTNWTVDKEVTLNLTLKLSK